MYVLPWYTHTLTHTCILYTSPLLSSEAGSGKLKKRASCHPLKEPALSDTDQSPFHGVFEFTLDAKQTASRLKAGDLPTGGSLTPWLPCGGRGSVYVPTTEKAPGPILARSAEAVFLLLMSSSAQFCFLRFFGGWGSSDLQQIWS